MSARPIIPGEQILAAIKEWGGNVTATAEALGIHPKNLRERLARLGVDLAAIRDAGRHVPHVPNVPVRIGTPGPSPAGTYGPDPAPRTLARRSGVATFPRMSGAAGAATQDAEAAPIRISTAPAKAVRVRPAFQEALREAKVEVIGRHKIDTDEQMIFDQFCDEAFGPWLRSKLAPAAPADSKAGTPRRARAQKDEEPTR